MQAQPEPSVYIFQANVEIIFDWPSQMLIPICSLSQGATYPLTVSLFLSPPVSSPSEPHGSGTGLFCSFAPQDQSSRGFLHLYMSLPTSVYTWHIVDECLVAIPFHDLGHLPRDNKRGQLSTPVPPTPALTSLSLLSTINWIRISSPVGEHFFASKPGPREHSIPWQRNVGLINFSLFPFESPE